METSFWIWLFVLLLIASFGLGIMISAYWGRGSVAVVFPEPVELSQPVAASPEPGPAEPEAPEPGAPEPAILTPELYDPEAVSQFQQGCEAYRAGRYRQAISRFQVALQLAPDLAEAQHNLARATANLRRVTEAIAGLVRASELYSQQGNGEQLALLKRDLEKLRG